jgi:GR25 family glycosyltransferase involved in LPS biosynthesis
MINQNIHVISLARTPQRLAAFRKQNSHIPARVFAAIDGRKVSLEQRYQLIDPSFAEYTQSSLGTTMSHRALWAQAVNSKNLLTICEDDAIFHYKFVEHADQLLSSLGSRWDFVLWGYNFDSVLDVEIPNLSDCVMSFSQDTMRKNRKRYCASDINPTLYRLINAFGITCYTVSPHGAQRLLEVTDYISKRDVFVRGLKRSIPNDGIDVILNRFYSVFDCHVCFAPLVVTENSWTQSTVQFTTR